MPAILVIGGILLVSFSGSFQLRSSPLSPTYGRLTFMLGEFLLILASGFEFHNQHPEWLGLPLFIAPGAGLAIALVVFGIASNGSRPTVQPVRSANLTTRTVGSYLSRASRRKLALLTAAVVVLVLIGGLTSSPDDSGFHRAFSVHSADQSATASPYPGWFYGVPFLLTVPVLALGIWVALRRVRLLPAITTDPARDARWRTSLAEVLLSTVEIALLCGMAGMVFGFATAFTPLASISPDPVPLFIVQAAIRGAGLALGVWAVVLFIRAVIRVFRFRGMLDGRDFAAPIPASRER